MAWLTVHEVSGPDSTEVAVTVVAVPHVVDVRLVDVSVHTHSLEEGFPVAEVFAEAADLHAEASEFERRKRAG